ncbi:MAG: GNAT family N-acetyltransferase [Saprospiraceae bacterium]|nr:GNAT family N-acetyltransferase [Saprospiraceae bacterium]HPK10341.1 GNAT family N-acetyltransferase [Saprospiraceae bacterium]
MNIRIDFGSPLYDESLSLRNKVLRIPLGLKFKIKDIATEYDSYHLGYLLEGSLVGILILKPELHHVKMRQVAIAPEFQNKGIGKKLVSFAEDYARFIGFTKIELNARDTAIPFYKSLNYKVLGDSFIEVGIVHSKMIKSL